MPRVIFSSELQRYTQDERTTVTATTYRDLVREVLGKYPDLPADEIRKMAVAIDGEIIHDPFLETMAPDAEVHFIFRISGG